MGEDYTPYTDGHVVDLQLGRTREYLRWRRFDLGRKLDLPEG
jgi:hypothetical protein